MYFFDVNSCLYLWNVVHAALILLLISRTNQESRWTHNKSTHQTKNNYRKAAQKKRKDRTCRRHPHPNRCQVLHCSPFSEPVASNEMEINSDVEVVPILQVPGVFARCPSSVVSNTQSFKNQSSIKHKTVPGMKWVYPSPARESNSLPSLARLPQREDLDGKGSRVGYKNPRCTYECRKITGSAQTRPNCSYHTGTARNHHGRQK